MDSRHTKIVADIKQTVDNYLELVLQSDLSIISAVRISADFTDLLVSSKISHGLPISEFVMEKNALSLNPGFKVGIKFIDLDGMVWLEWQVKR